mgnify:CR=1 FL=1
MPKPEIAGREPVQMELQAGETYYWCTCGRSDKQPWCDGTHKDTLEFRSLHFEVDQPCTRAVCMCKHTSTPPFCDGTHARVGDGE